MAGKIKKANMNVNLSSLLIAILFISTSSSLHCNNQRSLDLSYKNLKLLEPFEECHNLKILNLQHNHLQELSEDIFLNLTALEHIDLSHNNLHTIEEQVFRHMFNLTVIILDYNNLTSANFLNPLSQIEKVSLAHNKISTKINLHQCGHLKYVNLSYNERIQYEGDFNNCNRLIEVDFSHNKISTAELGTMNYLQLQLRRLDLSHNLIKNVTFDQLTFEADKLDLFLTDNQITQVNMSEAVSALTFGNERNPSQNKVFLDRNPIDCGDCTTFGLTKYFYKKLNSSYYDIAIISPNNLTCASPERLKNQLISALKPESFTCRIDQIECPDECKCSERSWDKTLIIDCGFRNLTMVPRLHISSKLMFNQYEVRLEGNQLIEGPSEGMGYEGVTKLYLNDNRLEEFTWMPISTQVINLHNNNLQNITFETLQMLNASTHLREISLYGNLWDCSCQITNFTNYIRQYSHRIVNREQTTCSDGYTLLIHVNESTACIKYQKIILTVCMVLLIIALIIALMILFYYKYNYEVKVWLFSHGYCISDEYDGKLYDAFISYSEQDENFVKNEIESVLEKSPEKYKLCLQYRDANFGELRTDVIESLIEDSMRTLIFLSKNFLDSVWNIHEFRMAHVKAMQDPKKRVIIIIYGNVDLQHLDDELDAYLKTNTYLEWGDPWFWRKLKYALPHKQNLRNRSRRFADNVEKVEMEEMATNNGNCQSDNSLLKNS